MNRGGRPRRDGGTASEDWQRFVALQEKTRLGTRDLAALLGISAGQLRLYRSPHVHRRPPERVLVRLAEVEKLVQAEEAILLDRIKAFLVTPDRLERLVVAGAVRSCPVCAVKMVGPRKTCTGWRGACGRKLREANLG
ncbi:MAG: hypothetical protein RB148_09465 [Armatimonadota bacterium]|nr:hypothetical protein [Armatimonadota bacterium]